MTTVRLDLAYDGSGFRGYAKQVDQHTVQEVLEAALLTLLGEPAATAVAGRTDAGVHAVGQVVSFAHSADVDVRQLRRSLNGIVGPEIAVMKASAVEDDFSARYSAVWRRYRYLINPQPAQDPLTRHITWHVGRELDFPAMQEAGTAFVGEHDFSSFCKSVEGKSNVRRVEELTWREWHGFYEMWIQANAFCHQMVRSIVGHLYDIGRGFADAGATADVLAAGDRSAVATVAPPHGLTLWEVGYPE